jgi:hypothetical protein
LTMCDNCLKEHPRTDEIMVLCAGTTSHGVCDWCWNGNAAYLVFEVRSDCVSIAWEGKVNHGPMRPRGEL